MDNFLSGWPKGAPPVVNVATDVSSALEVLAEGDGAVVVGFPDGLSFAMEIADLHRDRRIFVALDRDSLADLGLWRRAAGRGIVPVSADRAAAEVAAMLPGTASPKRDPVPIEAIIQAQREMIGRGERTRVIEKLTLACWSTRGGVGKTALAVNLSCMLARWGLNLRKDFRVALVDADADGGNLSYWLGCSKPRVTLPAWLDMPDKASWDTVKEYLLLHKPSGLYYLPRSIRATDEEFVTQELMEKVYKTLYRHCDAVIFDLGTSIRKENNYVPYVLSMVDIVLLVSRSDYPTIQSIKADLEELVNKWGLDLARIRLVLNRRSRGVEYKLKDIAAYVQVPLLTPALPEDPNVDRAANKGEPPVLKYPAGDFARAVSGIARHVVGSELWGEEKRGFWSRFMNVFKKGA
ncbi:P-loop NTPase [Desulfofundulus thermobenzoicus]|uniref:nucleotide-binding protein n=1 Tax=Desulfofundulus thermobenzoicus TaxID=29376 RepID=UPI0018843EE2